MAVYAPNSPITFSGGSDFYGAVVGNTITASGAVDANYTISYVPGTLTVNPVALTITADNKTKAYGAALPTLTVSYAGFVNSDTAGSLTTPPTITTTATAASHVSGNPYSITASGAMDADYTMARYPDAANGVPYEVYDRETAEAKVASAEAVLKWLRERTND